MAASPSSSPRLPSPPPIAEDQLGQMSPLASPGEHGKPVANPFEAGASRRIRPGTKAADMDIGPPLVDISEIESPFQLTEHLKSLHNAALHRGNGNSITPIDRQTAQLLAQAPEGVDKNLWLYELCRLLCKEINSIIVALFQDNPPCSASTCTEMRASEWQYLCAVHDPPKPCCAIDYCCHTLDWTNSVLTSQKNFPSRMNFGDAAGQQGGNTQVRQLTNIFRRVYRIFAHAWFQHREMYWKVEQRSGLYVFFKTVCDVFNLIPDDNYTVPPEAEGIEPLEGNDVDAERPRPTIMKRPPEEPSKTQALATGNETRRHRHTPSGTESITTVLEEEEVDLGEESREALDETIILHAEDAAADISDYASAPPGPDFASEPADEDEDEIEVADPSPAYATRDPEHAIKEDQVEAQANAAPEEAEAAGEKAAASPSSPPQPHSPALTRVKKVETLQKAVDEKESPKPPSASSDTSKHVMADTDPSSSQSAHASLESVSPSTTTACGATATTTASDVADPSRAQANPLATPQKASSSPLSTNPAKTTETVPAEAIQESLGDGAAETEIQTLPLTTRSSDSALTSLSKISAEEAGMSGDLAAGETAEKVEGLVRKTGSEVAGKTNAKEEKIGSPEEKTDSREMEMNSSSPPREKEREKSRNSSENSSSTSELQGLSSTAAFGGAEAVGASAEASTGTEKAAEGEEAGKSVGD